MVDVFEWKKGGERERERKKSAIPNNGSSLRRERLPVGSRFSGVN